MVQEKTVEKLQNSAVKLSITIPAEEVQSAYDGLVKKYAKSAQIKGFRKGKVPREILERKFGEGFRAEALQELVESGLEEVFQEIEERPLPYAQPRLADDEELELVLELLSGARAMTPSLSHQGLQPSLEGQETTLLLVLIQETSGCLQMTIRVF